MLCVQMPFVVLCDLLKMFFFFYYFSLVRLFELKTQCLVECCCGHGKKEAWEKGVCWEKGVNTDPRARTKKAQPDEYGAAEDAGQPDIWTRAKHAQTYDQHVLTT